MDIAGITALTKLLFDGLAVLVIFFLYLKADKRRQQEHEEDRKSMREENEKIRQQYGKVVEDIVNGVTGKHLTPEESKGIAQIDKQINETINIMRKETGASRVCIVRYHNGNKDMLGTSFLKMSMTNEVVNVGVAPIMSDFKDLFRSFLAYWCDQINAKGTCIIDDTEEMKNIDSTMYQYLHTRHIEARYGAAIKDNYGNVIGFVALEYIDKSEVDVEKVHDVMFGNLSKIQTLISINGGVNDEL